MTPNIIIAVVTILGSGFSVYVGVRVAIAEMRRDLKNHEERLNDQKERIERLESPFFQPRGGRR